MSIGEFFKEGGDVRKAWRHQMDVIKEARADGKIDPEEAVKIADAFAELTAEVADFIGVAVGDRDQLTQQIRSVMSLAKAVG